MKQTSTNSSVAFKKCLVLILTVLGFSFNQFVLVVMKKKVYPAVLRNGLKSLLVCMACWLMPFVAKADTPIPTSIVSSYDPVLRKLTMTVNWIWGSTDNSKIVSAAVFADLNGDGIVPTFLDNPATYNSGGNAFPAGLSAKDEFLGQLAISTIEGSASSGTYTDNTDNGIAATIGNFGTSDPRVLFPYGTTTVNSVGLSGSFTMTFTNLNVAPTKICVVMYDVHTDKLTSLSGNHSARSANPDHNGDNSVEDGNSNGRVSCTGLASLSCAINKTESACQSQAAINASYAAWLASVTASGCNGVLTNNSTGAPSATGGSKTVTFTYTQSGCSNQAAVTTCTATFTVPTCPNSIGDRVWLDADGNGIQDASETGGITGVTVQLRNSANTVIATQNTNATGNYLFTGLAAGTYTVVFPVSISGAVVTTANVGTNDDIDSDPSQATGITGNIVLAAGQGIVNVDAGYCPITLQIGNRVFNDLNNNGIDNTEAGISSATVNLYKDDNNDNVADGASIATVTTNSTGNYTFANLSPGNYIVGVVTPAGFVSSAINGGDPDNNTDLDDNGQVTVGIETRGLAITLISGTEPNGDVNNTYDFGFYTPPPPLTLGNKVFFDLNRSGMYEATDSVASGIIVRLYADANNDNIPDGAFIQAASTNGLGEYSFTNLAAGNYIVGAVIPLVHAITVINGGDPDNNIDNDNNAINNVSGEARGNSISLASGTEPTAGNTNNTYDIGFYNPTLPPNGGQNCFAGTNPVVYAKSFWNVNANSQTVTLRVTFSKKFVDNTYGTGAIGWPNGHTFGNLTGSDHLQWSIRDANGVEKLVFKQDYISASASFPSGYGCLGFGGDGGTPTVGLATDVLSFRTSIAANFNDFGYVLTTNSPATDTFYTPNPAQPNWMYDVWYEVTVKASIFGAPGFGFVNVASVHASPSKTGNNTEIITNTPCVSSIGDRVWYDTDRDGIQDAGENGIRGVTVKLRNAANTVIATQVTNTTGNYLFTGLNAGTYTVEFPTTVYGYILSPAYVGTNRHIDSDPSVSTGITPSIVLGTADDIRTIDAGYAPDCACTNSTGNLLVNANFENGTTGWSWSGGTLTTGTGYVACGAANGFNNWSAGTSRVWQDVTASAGATVSFSAFAGTHAPGIACSPKLSLIFLNSANAVISQIDVTVTRVVGDYNDQLEQYSITAVAPAGTTKVRVQSSITCNTMKLDAFCLTVSPTGSIGDFVWEDLNRNGLQEANEPGIGGVTVTLSGTSSATTTTAANGSYSFNNLAAGTYNVTFATPVAPGNTFLPTTSNVGANDAIDSDPVGGVVSNIVLAAGQVNNTVDAGFYRLLNLSGNVWHDVNGMLDSLVNNTRGDSAAVIPTGLKMILVDANTSLVVRTTLVQGNGAFNFPNILPGTYILVLKVESANIADPSPFASLPDGWRNTGEKLGLNLAKVPPLHDGVINGKLTVTVSTVSVTNANFGINFGGDFPIN